MSAEPLRVLLVEDDEDDFILTSRFLSEFEGRKVDLKWAGSYEAAALALGRGGYDVCLVDYYLGERTGLELLREAARVNPGPPMIMLTSHAGHDVDTEAFRAGAAGYLIKGEVSAPLLERSIRYAARRPRQVEGARELAGRDELTGLYNRRALDDLLGEEADRHCRYGRPAALVMLDVDGFESVNEAHGRAAGDEVLCRLAQLLRETIRAADIPARSGEDELAVLLPEKDSRQALEMAERVRRRVAAGPCEWHGRDGQPLQIPVTVSLGVAGLPEHGPSARALYTAAAEALRTAKRGGRNRAVRFRDVFEKGEAT